MLLGAGAGRRPDRRGGREAERCASSSAWRSASRPRPCSGSSVRCASRSRRWPRSSSERLDRSEKATGQVVTDLRERLVRIDEAQKKIGELSTQVVSLQEILTNKQARGAFGEVQLNDLVPNALPPSAYEFQSHAVAPARASTAC